MKSSDFRVKEYYSSQATISMLAAPFSHAFCITPLGARGATFHLSHLLSDYASLKDGIVKTHDKSPMKCEDKSIDPGET